jgi:hypothetical protein
VPLNSCYDVLVDLGRLKEQLKQQKRGVTQ